MNSTTETHITFPPVTQVIQRMERIKQELLQAGDANVFFTEVYLVTTRRFLDIADAVSDESHSEHAHFEHLDSHLLKQMVTLFAEKYFSAYTEYRRGCMDKVPLPWKTVFEFTRRSGYKSNTILQGVVTHVGVDLPFVLSAQLANGEVLYRSRQPRAKATYLVLNSALADLLPQFFSSVSRLDKAFDAVSARPVRPLMYQRLFGLLGNRMSRVVVYWLIKLTRQEAEWLALKLQRGKITRPIIERKINNRIRILCGKFIFLRFWVFLGYGLIARLLNREELKAHDSGQTSHNLENS